MAIFTNTTDYNNRNQGRAMKTLIDWVMKRTGGGNAPTASPTAPGNTSDDLIRQLIQGEMSQRQGTPKPFQVDRRDVELTPAELTRKGDLENTSTRRYWAGRQMQSQGTDAATLDAKAKAQLADRQRVWDAEAAKKADFRKQYQGGQLKSDLDVTYGPGGSIAARPAAGTAPGAGNTGPNDIRASLGLPPLQGQAARRGGYTEPTSRVVPFAPPGQAPPNPQGTPDDWKDANVSDANVVHSAQIGDTNAIAEAQARGLNLASDPRSMGRPAYQPSALPPAPTATAPVRPGLNMLSPNPKFKGISDEEFAGYLDSARKGILDPSMSQAVITEGAARGLQ